MLHAGDGSIQRQIARMRNLLSFAGEVIYALVDNAFHDRRQGVCQPTCWCQVAARLNSYYDGIAAMPAPASRFDFEMKTHESQRAVIAAALSLASSQIYFEIHPADPHGDAQCELHEDMLWDAVKDYYLNEITLRAMAR